MRKWILGAAALALFTTCAVAQRQGERLSPACRQEFVKQCGVTREQQAVSRCLRGKLQEFSKECRAEIGARMSAVRERSGESTGGGSEYAYASHARQNLDYWPVADRKAPLMVFIHGGGWAIGDKKAGTGGKPEFYNNLGFAFASLNYRLVPDAQPDGQAADIASALAWLRGNAERLGFDGDRIYLMGHSAGAHLAALVSADTSYLDNAGVPLSAIKGTVLLDGAGYDVVRQMASKHNRVQGMYNAAFGKDPAVHKALSPITYVGQPNVVRWLLLSVENRPDAKEQSEALAKALVANGVAASARAVPDSSHASVNQDAGEAGTFVGDAIADFLKD